ncbi:MAG: efflux RND transporter periplasmic adaptor subunit [Bacteroidales bacterium]
MRKYYVLSGIALILLTLVIIKIVKNRHKAENQVAKVGSPAVKAECYLVRDTIINLPVRAVGYLKANERIEIVSELSRRITKINFKEGSQVKKGDLLIQLDDAEWVASMKKNNAELELARLTEDRNYKLFQSGGLSQQIYEESVSRRKILEAEAETLQVMIEKAKIRASFNGTIGIRTVSEGAFVSPGIVLTTLEDLSSLKIEFTIPESYAKKVQAGALIRFTVEGIPDTFEAMIEAADPSINKESGNLRILARVKGPTNNLIPGTAISMNLVSQSAAPGLYVPTQALLPTPGGYKVYQVHHGKAKLVSVMTGIRSERMVEIKEGVNTGDSILVTGFMKVRPDSKILISKTW